MAFSNELQRFASDAGADVFTPAQWLNHNDRLVGFVAGIGDPKPLNTAIRQAAFTSAMIGQFTADYGIDNVLDDGDVPKYEANFVAALKRILAVVAPTNLLYEGTDTGTANAAVVTATNPALSGSFPTGYFIAVRKIATSNSGAMTLQVLGSSGAIHWPDGSPMGPGDYPGSSEAIFYFDGSTFQLITWTGKVSIVSLAGGEGILVANAAVSLNFPALTEEDDLAATDLFAFYQTIAEGGLLPNHHRKTTWGNIVAKVIAQVHRPLPAGLPPAIGGGIPGPEVGNFVTQQVYTPNPFNGPSPALCGYSVGMIASGADLQRGSVPSSLDYQSAMHSASPPLYTTRHYWFAGADPLGQAGDWDWPFIMQGTWRLAGWNWNPTFLYGYNFSFYVYWVRIS